MSRQFAEAEFASWDARIFSQVVQLKEDAFASGGDVLEALMQHVMRPCLNFVAAGKCSRGRKSGRVLEAWIRIYKMHMREVEVWWVRLD